MVDLEGIKERILKYLNEFPVESRREYQIVINYNVKELLTLEQLVDLEDFSKLETGKPIHITPFIESDIIVVNNKQRPIKNIMEMGVDLIDNSSN